MDTSDDGMDVEVLCHMMCRCIACSNKPDTILLELQKTLDDARKTIYENRKVEQATYYGRE